jgi:hypothetical protein
MLAVMRQTCSQLGALVVRNGRGKSLARDAVEDILGKLEASRRVELHDFVDSLPLPGGGYRVVYPVCRCAAVAPAAWPLR